MTALAGASRVLFLHAHPDDETLATGVLIADLIDRGIDVGVVTATRGERGEVADPALVDRADLVTLRERELTAALRILGVHSHGFLGQPPARAPGLPARRYTDSGMAWVTPELAGPGPDADPDALTAAAVPDAAADLAAYAAWFGADVLVSYDADGGYGHPDHVACHRIARAAAGLAGTGFAEVVSQPDETAASVLEQHRERVVTALRQYRSQLRVEGGEVVHVGGQRHPIPTVVVLREQPPGGQP